MFFIVFLELKLSIFSSNMRKYIALILIATGLVSCEESVGWIDEMEVTPELVVSAFWTTDSIVNQYQYLSVHMTGMQSYQDVDEYEQAITVNGQSCDESYCFRPGDVVKLKVKAKGRQAEATTTVPQPLEVVGVDTIHIQKPHEYEDRKVDYLRFLVHVRQPEGMKGIQYFRLEVQRDFTYYTFQCDENWSIEAGQWVTNTSIDDVTHWTESSHQYQYDADVALKENEQSSNSDDDYIDWADTPSNIYGTFRNTVFKKGEYTLCVDVENEISSLYQYDPYIGIDKIEESKNKAGYSHAFTFRIYTTPRIEYLYLNALSALSNYSPGNITTIPPVVPSNIEGGTGIFSISAKTEFTLTEGPGQLLFEGDKVPE